MNLCWAKPAEIQVIYFGSACEEGRTVSSYIQVSHSNFFSPDLIIFCACLWRCNIQNSGNFSFFFRKTSAYCYYLILLGCISYSRATITYRSPEVLLGYPYPYITYWHVIICLNFCLNFLLSLMTFWFWHIKDGLHYALSEKLTCDASW